MRDQAAQLREMARKRQQHQPQWQEGKARYIVVSSAKGGVGKSFVALTMAEYYARTGASVLLIDANLHTPALHILTNMTPQFSVQDMLAYRVDEEQLIFTVLPENIQLLANEGGTQFTTRPSLDNAMFFLEQIHPLRRVFDVIIFDTHTGLDSWNLSLLQAAQTVLFVVSPEPTAIIDSYLLVKAAHEFVAIHKFYLLVNQTLTADQGKEAASKLNMALSHFLDIELPIAGALPFNLSIRKLMQEQVFPFTPHLKGKLNEQIKHIWENLPEIVKSSNKEVAI